MLFIKLIFILTFGFLLWVRLKTLLTYFQQEEYDGSRFLPACLKMRLYDIKATGVLILAIAAIAIGLPQEPAIIITSVVFILISVFENKYRFKKKMVLTARAQRIQFLSVGLVIIPIIASFFSLIASIVAVQILPMILIIADKTLQPYQNKINRSFITEAKAKLERKDPIRIGITGSFGKTTVKHILAEILGASGNIFYSKGSINTILGLTRHIRERLQWSQRYFIAEMGAYSEGSISKLCEFVEPQYGIVTAVGDAHTERFGDITTIARAKSELAEFICKSGGVVVINSSVLVHQPFKLLKVGYPDNVISVGEINADLKITSKRGKNGLWHIFMKSNISHIPSIDFDTPLLGEHNIMNSALAVALTLVVDPKTEKVIPHFTQNLAQIRHRLERIDNPGRNLILDDAFNSNEGGFTAAVSVLTELASERGGRSILVTPGIAELGNEHDAIHFRLGTFCSDKCSLVYVVNPKRVKSFVAGLTSGQVKVIEVASFLEARKKIELDINKEDVVLYENDLPDVLEEQRLL